MKKTEEREPMILNISTLALEVSRIILCCIMATSLMGCTTQGNGLVAPVNREPGPIGPDELEAFTDRFFGEQMDELHIPGLTFIITQRFRAQFFDHFFPSDSQALPVYPSTTDLARLTGRYRHVRYPHSAIYETDFSPFDILVAKSNDHILVDDVEYGEIAPLVFQEVGGAGIIVFRGDDEGDITYMFIFSSEASEKLDQ